MSSFFQHIALLWKVAVLLELYLSSPAEDLEEPIRTSAIYLSLDQRPYADQTQSLKQSGQFSQSPPECPLAKKAPSFTLVLVSAGSWRDSSPNTVIMGGKCAKCSPLLALLG